MLAIIIPYYKLSFFEETLKSLSNQSDKRFVVYIGNDASNENPEEVITKYNDKINIKYHVFKKNIGGTSLVKQWERCIKLINDEEWIMVLGDDDFLESNVVELFYQYYHDFVNKANVIRFATQTVLEKGDKSSNVFKHPILEKPTDSFYRKHKGETRSSLSEHIFSVKKYKKHGFYNYPLAWCSDDRAWLDFSEEKFIYSINEAKVFVRISSVSISGMQNNLILKKLSTSLFYGYLVSNKLDEFSNQERFKIIDAYFNKLLAIRKVTFSKWLFFCSFYINFYDKKIFIKFVKKMIKYILRVNN